jgi:D-sedoheptulose 7-phosphate isomerase
MEDLESHSLRYIGEVKGILTRMEKDLPPKIREIVAALVKARNARRRIYTLGNGGSASTASHMASDLNKGASRHDAPRFRAVALTDSIPSMLAWGNDSSYGDIFVEQLKNHLEKGDVVIAISGSGNSENVLKAVEYANKEGAVTIGLTGFDGGKLARMAKISYIVPSNCMQQIEDIHLLIEHMLSMMLKDSHECGM